MSELRLLTRLCLLVCVQQAPARLPEEKLPAYVGTSSPPVDPRASRARVLGWVGSLSV